MERGWVHLAAWEKVYRALLVLNLDVLVVAYEKARLRQLEDMLDVANWADNLAGSDVLDVGPTTD